MPFDRLQTPVIFAIQLHAGQLIHQEVQHKAIGNEISISVPLLRSSEL